MLKGPPGKLISTRKNSHVYRTKCLGEDPTLKPLYLVPHTHIYTYVLNFEKLIF